MIEDCENALLDQATDQGPVIAQPLPGIQLSKSPPSEVQSDFPGAGKNSRNRTINTALILGKLIWCYFKNDPIGVRAKLSEVAVVALLEIHTVYLTSCREKSQRPRMKYS